MTNGIIDIELNGLMTRLRFGYQACMEFERMLYINPSTNQSKIFTDLLYAGLYGEAMRSQKDTSELYEKAYDLLDDVVSLDNSADISVRIWDTYYQSKWGQDFKKRLEDFTKESKKKVEEEKLSQLIQESDI